MTDYERDTVPIGSPAAAIVPTMLSARDFVGGFIAPDFLIEDTVQRGYLYSLTGRTGDGKTAVATTAAICVAAGLPFAGRKVEQGAVAFFAGENADDVRARLLMACEFHEIVVDDLPLYFFDRPFDLVEGFAEIKRQVEAVGGVSLAIVDTAAAFFQGDEENSNTELGRYARDLRKLCELPGKPCTIVCAHPTKSATRYNLVPRGGGAFLAEVDGNLRVWSEDKETADLHWCGKLRGPGFEPITFELEKRTSEQVKDSKQRLIPNVVAVPMTEADMSAVVAKVRSDEDALLEDLLQHPNASFAQRCERLGWMTEDSGQPRKSRVFRLLERLADDKLVTQRRGIWMLTNSGKIEAQKVL